MIGIKETIDSARLFLAAQHGETNFTEAEIGLVTGAVVGAVFCGDTQEGAYQKVQTLIEMIIKEKMAS